jgi:hypothetical protein
VAPLPSDVEHGASLPSGAPFCSAPHEAHTGSARSTKIQQGLTQYSSLPQLKWYERRTNLEPSTRGLEESEREVFELVRKQLVAPRGLVNQTAGEQV